MLSGKRLDQPLELIALAHVAGGDADVSAELDQLGAQLLGTWSARAAAADEQKVLGSRLGKPARDMSSQPAGGAREEDRAARRRPCLPEERLRSGSFDKSSRKR